MENLGRWVYFYNECKKYLKLFKKFVNISYLIRIKKLLVLIIIFWIGNMFF